MDIKTRVWRVGSLQAYAATREVVGPLTKLPVQYRRPDPRPQMGTLQRPTRAHVEGHASPVRVPGEGRGMQESGSSTQLVKHDLGDLGIFLSLNPVSVKDIW